MDNGVNRKSEIIKTLLVVLAILLASMLLEATLFNLRHLTTRAIDFDDSQLVINRNSDYSITISNIDQVVRTVYMEVDFGETGILRTRAGVEHRDKNSQRTHFVYLINGYDRSFYLTLGAMGDVSFVTVTLHDTRLTLQNVVLNTSIPWVFMWPRVIMLSLGAFLFYFWKKHKVGSILFNPQSKVQRLADAGVLLTTTTIMLLAMAFTVNFGWIPNSDASTPWQPPPDWGGHHRLNDRMVESILRGQLHLDIPVHESLLSATQPYSLQYRIENNVIVAWDHVFFEGRYYNYFGIVPTVIAHLPYYLITGNHVSATVTTMLFSAIALIGIYFLWREVFSRYFGDSSYSLYIFGLIFLLFGTNLMVLSADAGIYQSVIAAATMFSVWGIFFILRSTRDTERLNRKFVFWGVLFMALAVGCRPTAIFASLLVPALLWPYFIKKDFGKKTVIDFIALALPYMVIGGALMWYNYARFGSITEFGHSYHITIENHQVIMQVGLLGYLQRGFDGLWAYLFSPVVLRSTFPFILPSHPTGLFAGHHVRTALMGAFVFPAMWFPVAVFYLRKMKEMRFVIALIVVSLLLMIFSGVLVGVAPRYSVDFYWMLSLAAAICICAVSKKALAHNEAVGAVVRRIGVAVFAVSGIMLVLWGARGEAFAIFHNNPVVIQYLIDLFTIF
ncbi:MAG: hypothetical protein FWC71_07500 [Defluviitaleaceae bacterium]|nr:hypothetical protein [Defluviitaleaceae bacterium]